MELSISLSLTPSLRAISGDSILSTLKPQHRLGRACRSDSGKSAVPLVDKEGRSEVFLYWQGDVLFHTVAAVERRERRV